MLAQWKSVFSALRPYEHAVKSEVKRYGSEKADNESCLKRYAYNGENRREAEVDDGHRTARDYESYGAAA